MITPRSRPVPPVTYVFSLSKHTQKVAATKIGKIKREQFEMVKAAKIENIRVKKI